MSIKVQQLCPIPIKDRDLSESDIWLKNLSFEKGNKYQIYAPSGSGKTTLLHSIYGMREDYEGSIHVNDIVITPKSVDQIRSKWISIIFQDLMLFPDLSARQNILIKTDLTSKSQFPIEEWANILNVDKLLNKKVNQLSRGERQRVAIIRALSMDFDWLLLDEPFSHLDEETTNCCIDLIKSRINELNAGLILCNIAKDKYFNYDSQLNL